MAENRPLQKNELAVLSRRRQIPSLASLRAFEAAARFRSFKRAADELCVTESSISHQIRGLERHLSVKLFDRLHRQVSLTTEGIQYMLVVSKAFADIERSSIGLMRNRESSADRGKLVIACEPGFANNWLSPRMRAFSEVASHIDVEIIPTLEPARELSNRATIGIHYGWRITGAFHCEEIARTRIFPVCTPHLLPLTSNLSSIVLLHDRTVRMWGEWIEAAGIENVNWRCGPVFHSSAMCVDAALRSEGIALANELTAGWYLEREKLVQPFGLIIDPPGYRWYIVTDSSSRDSEESSIFRDWLSKELQFSSLALLEKKR